MTKKYRVVNLKQPIRPSGEPGRRVQTGVRREEKDPNRGIVVIEQQRGSMRWFWSVTILVLAIAVLALLWMSQTGASLTHLSQATSQNAQAMQNQQAQLSGMQGMLQSIHDELRVLEANMSTFFANLTQSLRAR